jgi:hypothetical protein
MLRQRCMRKRAAVTFLAMSSSLTIAIGAVAVGCDGVFNGSSNQGGGDGGVVIEDPRKELAKANFDVNVRPFLTNTCAACHASGLAAYPQFLAGPDLYVTLMNATGLVIPGDPAASRLYIYGQSTAHSGTKLTPDQATAIHDWIALEPSPDLPDAGIGQNSNTQLMTPNAGANTVDLAMLNPTLPGATMTFTYTPLTGGMYFTQLTVKAGTAMGVHIYHPLFVFYPTADDPHPDPVDSFYNLDVNIDPGATVMLGGGTVVLANVPSGSQLSIRFEKLEKEGAAIDGGTLAGGCKDVTTFTASAQPVLANNVDASAQACFSCHGGSNAGATSAFDLRMLKTMTPAGQLAACNQVKGKINLANPTSSILFQRPKPPQMTGHPFTFADTTTYNDFANPILVWVTKEQ